MSLHSANSFELLSLNFSELALILLRRGEKEQGVACLLRAASVATKSREIVNYKILISVEYLKAHQFDMAEDVLQSCLSISPTNGTVWFFLGDAWRHQGKHSEAIDAYEKAIGYKERVGDAYNNRGICFRKVGLLKDAESSFRMAVRKRPNSAAPLVNLGWILDQKGEYKEAMSAFQKAINFQPSSPEAYTNLANAQRHAGRFSDAAKSARVALRFKPNMFEALTALGGALEEDGDLVGAVEAWFEAARVNKHSLVAMANIRSIKERLCMWNDWEQEIALLQRTLETEMDLAAASSMQINMSPFHVLYTPLPVNIKKAIAESHSTNAEKMSSLIRKGIVGKEVEWSDDEFGMLNLGYLSSDFRQHAVGVFLQHVFDFHDPKQVSVFCFSTSRDDRSTTREYIRNSCQHFVDVSGLSDSQIAMRILQLRIHVLVNLNGWTTGNRPLLWPLKSSPIQIVAQGFPSTYGASYISHIITDRVATPPTMESDFSEHFVYFPGSYMACSHRYESDLTLSLSTSDRQMLSIRDQLGLPRDAFVFCSFNHLYKTDPEILDVWTNILKRTDQQNSVLFLLKYPTEAVDNLMLEFAARGIDESRIVTAGWFPEKDHFLMKSAADLFLDTVSYNGHGTVMDALWAGIPVLCMPGSQMASRVAASIVFSTEHDLVKSLVVSNFADYEDMAVFLAGNEDVHNQIRTEILDARENSDVFRTERWTKNMEMASQMLAELEMMSNSQSHVILQ